MWRVGTGSVVSIYEDCWVPGLPYGRLLSPRCLPEFSRVASLFQRPGRWNEELVRQCFLADEATAILAIPLSQFPKEDSIMWKFDSKGFFSVRSAYRTALCVAGKEAASSSGGPLSVWKDLWKLPIPSKIRIFL